jgi:hypothetical protein
MENWEKCTDRSSLVGSAYNDPFATFKAPPDMQVSPSCSALKAPGRVATKVCTLNRATVSVLGGINCMICAWKGL